MNNQLKDEEMQGVIAAKDEKRIEDLIDKTLNEISKDYFNSVSKYLVMSN